MEVVEALEEMVVEGLAVEVVAAAKAAAKDDGEGAAVWEEGNRTG